MALLTNTGDLLTNLPSEGGGGGGGSDPAEVVNALTVANQAARLALTSTDVQPLDLVLQSDTGALYVLLASDPSQAGNWSRLPGNDASLITTGTLDGARLPTWMVDYTSYLELDRNLKFGSAKFIDFSSGGGAPGASDYGYGVESLALRLQVGDSGGQIRQYSQSACVVNTSVTGLAVGLGTTAASAPLHARNGSGAQIIGDHSSGNQFALQADGSGDLTITPSGTLVTLPSGKNLAITAPTVPGSASATGVAGQIAWDSGYIYVCTASNTWKRVAIATW